MNSYPKIIKIVFKYVIAIQYKKLQDILINPNFKVIIFLVKVNEIYFIHKIIGRNNFFMFIKQYNNLKILLAIHFFLSWIVMIKLLLHSIIHT